MVRINLVEPKKLTDQHLVAEYNEILMLIGHVRKHPEIKAMPKEYILGKGHILFFKNKLVYLKKRHELIKNEMLRRGFKPKKTIR
ncbi:endonuclease, partial [Candidatus Woesearchaeota archaeon]|nr:endonuclease [Candidatus Woesearchaeota archaeon]